MAEIVRLGPGIREIFSCLPINMKHELTAFGGDWTKMNSKSTVKMNSFMQFHALCFIHSLAYLKQKYLIITAVELDLHLKYTVRTKK